MDQTAGETAHKFKELQLELQPVVAEASLPVQRLPEAQEHRPVQVALVIAELEHGDVPLLHVGVQADFVVLEMEGFDCKREGNTLYSNASKLITGL